MENILFKIIFALLALLFISNLFWWSYLMYNTKTIYNYDFDVTSENYNHNINSN